MFLKTKRGFTLVEILIAVMITVGAAAIAIPLITKNVKSSKNLSVVAENMTSLLQLAQQKSVSQEDDHAWGVHFENPASGQDFFTMYYDTYSTSTRFEVYYLVSPVEYLTPTTSASVDVLFNKLVGDTNLSGTQQIKLSNNNQEKTVNICKQGIVAESDTSCSVSP